MKKFGPIAAIASGIGGYLLLAFLSGAPAWFGDSTTEATIEDESPAVLEVSMTEEAGAEPPGR